MASDTTILKSFLVALGYREDSDSRRKMLEGIEQTSKAVIRLGAVIESTALAVSVGVARWASSLESLYFASQRTASSADQLQAFGLAARNFGASIDEAQGSVEGLAAFLRENPGGSAIVEGWLGRVGLSVKGVTSDEQRLALIGQMFKMEREQGQWFLAHQQAGQLGITDRTALAMSSPGFAAELARQARLVKGLQAAAAAAHVFERAWNDLKQAMKQQLLPFEMAALAALERLMPKLSKLMHDHGKQIVDDLSVLFAYFIDGIGKLFDFLDKHGKEMIVRLEALFFDLNFNFTMYIQPVFSWLYTKLLELDKATDGWSTKLLTIYGILKLMGATGLIGGIANLGVGLAKALGGLAAAATGAEAWGAAGAAFGATAALSIAGAVGVGLGWLFDKIFPNNPLAKLGHWVGGKAADFNDWARDLLDPKKQAQFNADPRNFYASHWPWEKPPAPGAGGSNFSVVNNITVHGNADPQKVGDAIGDATEQRLRRMQSALVREFNAVIQ